MLKARRMAFVAALCASVSLGACAAPMQRAAAPAPAAAPVMQPGAQTIDERTDALVAQMTEDEKLTLVFGYFGSKNADQDYNPPAEARFGSAGYVPGIPRLGIPPQWQTDAGIGVATQGSSKEKRGRTALPSGIATTATWNRKAAYAGGAMIGDEARRSGFNVMLAGGVNLMREPRNGRNFEYGGEDPLLAGTMVGAQVAGIQSNNIVSTIKHYAINDQETDRDSGNSILDRSAARMSDLLAFQMAIEIARPGSIMCSYNKVEGTHACEHPWLLTDVLRRDWGWQGYVMSDWGATHSTVAAANAGLEQDSGFPFDKQPYFGKPLKEAVARGEVSQARLTEMARRIVRALIATGAMDNPVAEQAIDYAAHADITRRDAEEGIVLLKNAAVAGGVPILPLSADVKSIVVIGGHADKGVLAGSGSSLVYPAAGNAVPGIAPTSWPGPVMYYPSAPLAEIRRQAPNATVTFVDGSDPAKAAAAARDADVAIVFATQWAGESFDVSLTLTDNQDALIDAVGAANARTVVVVESGGPVLMPWAERVGGILAAWYPGTEGGAAIANILFGRVNPSGHLPATFPASLAQLPNPAEPKPGDVTYSEGAAVGYKWHDLQGHTPLFPFGHGLSYTSFALSGLEAKAADGSIAVSFDVANTGARDGMAVPQIYVGPAGGKGWEAPKRLGGFDKIALAPGASQRVSLSIDPRLLATYSEARRQWSIAGGAYKVMLASSAADIAQTVTVTVPARTMPATWRPATAVR